MWTGLGYLLKRWPQYIPETTGWRWHTHRILAFFGAFFLMPTLYILAFTPFVPLLGRYASGICLTIMAGIFVTLVSHKAEHKYFLVLQASFFSMKQL